MRYKVKSKTIDLQVPSFKAWRILPFFSGNAYRISSLNLHLASFKCKKEKKNEFFLAS